jgi:branched-subunit amino acid aminotransferase/4-amino-4-deoxychorismate lyase
MSATEIFRWRGGALRPLEPGDLTGTEIIAADSWLVTGGTMLALELHRQRFMDAVTEIDLADTDLTGTDLTDTDTDLDVTAFWDAAIAAIPRSGDWFPRVELRQRADAFSFVFRLRGAPERTRSVRLATHRGADPRGTPSVKGPDLAALASVRTAARDIGADDAVILSADGYVVETTSSALLWWRGGILCAPAIELERVDSVTARSVLTLATALGIDVYYEAVTPVELEAVELWSLNAVQGIRIVTEWIDGPAMAELPGRLAAWRTRLDRLRKPLR